MTDKKDTDDGTGEKETTPHVSAEGETPRVDDSQDFIEFGDALLKGGVPHEAMLFNDGEGRTAKMLCSYCHTPIVPVYDEDNVFNLLGFECGGCDDVVEWRAEGRTVNPDEWEPPGRLSVVATETNND